MLEDSLSKHFVSLWKKLSLVPLFFVHLLQSNRTVAPANRVLLQWRNKGGTPGMRPPPHGPKFL